MRIHEKIREVIDATPGLTQKGLAECMGVNPAAVNRMLHGRRNIMAEELPVIEDYLGLKLSQDSQPEPGLDYLHALEDGRERQKGLSEAGAHASYSVPKWTEMMVPVYGALAGAIKPGLNLATGVVADWVLRHPSQQGIKDAFAVYVWSNAMEPRYFPGELIYVHPGRPPEAGKDCVVEFQRGDAHIMRYLGQTENVIRLGQYNPSSEAGIKKSDVKAVYTIVGRG